MKTGFNSLKYNFYYYSNDGEHKLNWKTFLLFGLVLVSTLIIMSVEQLFQDKYYLGLAITTIIFIIIVITIRKLNNTNHIEKSSITTTLK